MTPLERVLDSLDAMGKVVKFINGQHMAQCPAHDDRNPSLAIREGDEGVILTCHAGCLNTDVVGALGLEMKELFHQRNPLPPRGVLSERGRPAGFPGVLAPVGEERPVPESPGTSSAPTIVANGSGTLNWITDYIYETAAGVPVVKISRYHRVDATGRRTGKAFFQFGKGSSGTWQAGLDGLTPPLYRLPAVLTAVAEGRPVWVVEGERDADAVTAAGACATTSPMGAGKWRPEHSAMLAGAHVIIVADDDPPGRRHAASVGDSLGAVAASIKLALPPAPHNDLSDALAAGVSLSEVRWVDRATLEATESPEVMPEGRTLRTTPASSFSPRRVRWGWDRRMPIGELTLIPGREGTGKSLFLAWIASCLTRGTLAGEWVGEPRAVLYVASEDSWHYTISPRLIAAGADLDLVHRLDADDGGTVIIPMDCEQLADVAMSINAAAVMLDPIISLIDDRLSVNQARELRTALEPLRRAAERAKVMVLALAHFNKIVDTDVLSRIPGARAWAEVARAAFGIAEDEEQGHYVASQIKNNLGRLDLPSLTYRIEGVLIDAEGEKAETGKLTWTGESDTTVGEVLSRKPGRGPGREPGELSQLIVDYIESIGCPIPVADVYQNFPLVKRETVRQALKRSCDRGTLSSPIYGHYGPGRVTP
jgi:hypothetical protein